MGTMRRFLAAVLLGTSLLTTAGPVAAASPQPADVQTCMLPPGVYGIYNSSGVLVGLLIVYPDCRTEIYPKPPLKPVG